MTTIRKLNPELAKLVSQMGETPERLEHDLRLFKEWIMTQPHLRNNVKMDDQWLAQFLRGSKYHLARAQQRLDRYYQNKTLFPEHITNVDPLRKEIQAILKAGIFLYVPPKNVNACGHSSIVLYRSFPNEGFDFDIMDDLVRIQHMVGCVLLTECDNTFVAGQTCIVDLSGNSSKMIPYCTPANIKKLVDLGKDCFPIKVPAHHLVNVSPLWEKVITIFKMFLTEKAKKRVFIHKDPSTLANYIPRSHLPEEYGGTAGTLQEITDNLKKKLEDNRDWLIEDYKYRSDETLRPIRDKLGDSKHMEGAFRKLAVD